MTGARKPQMSRTDSIVAPLRHGWIANSEIICAPKPSFGNASRSSPRITSRIRGTYRSPGKWTS